MKAIGFLPVALLFLGSVDAPQEVKSFRDQQLQYPRVRAAAKEKDDAVRRMCEEKKISYPPGQRHIPIEIFPSELAEDGLKSLAKSHANQPELLAFWSNLREGFDLFEKDHRALKVTVAGDGRYKFNQERGSVESH
jgi:hypothetical protein